MANVGIGMRKVAQQYAPAGRETGMRKMSQEGKANWMHPS